MAIRLGMYETGPDGKAGWELRRERIDAMHPRWRSIQKEIDEEDRRYSRSYDDFLRCWRVMVTEQMRHHRDDWKHVEGWAVRSDYGDYRAATSMAEGIDDGWLDIDSYHFLRQIMFRIWTRRRVYFPYIDDGVLLCGSVSRMPTLETGFVLGGPKDTNTSGYLAYGGIVAEEEDDA